jgi:hypothetical protein
VYTIIIILDNTSKYMLPIQTDGTKDLVSRRSSRTASAMLPSEGGGVTVLFVFNGVEALGLENAGKLELECLFELRLWPGALF